MNIFPAIDLFEKKAVRLLKGDYNKMTVYSENPVEVAKGFEAQGAEFLHVVDLEGAKDGTTANIETVKNIIENTDLKVEIGGGIRSMDVIEKYVSMGVFRVILGTAAITQTGFVEEAVKNFGDKICVGVDIKNQMVATHGWMQVSDVNCFDFCRTLSDIGVKTIICTDISKDGAMMGTNIELYRDLKSMFDMNIISSGGVSSIEDVKKLNALDLYGAIIGKALYTGDIDLSEAIKISKSGVANI